MLRIDRYIAVRFLIHFATLFVLLFVFATVIDLILNLDRFVDMARSMSGEEASLSAFLVALVQLVADFHGPRIAQFYSYVHGLVAVGAMGFALAQMHRHRELVAVMASGVSLHRMAMPFFVVVFGLSIVQLANQEFLLPRIAPLLLRSHGDVGFRTVNTFEVPLATDGNGHVFQAASYDPREHILYSPTILERDEKGRTIRRTTAERAEWNDEQSGWSFVSGRTVTIRTNPETDSEQVTRDDTVELFVTDLDPRGLLVRRYGQYASMLSLNQIGKILSMPNVAERDRLLRYRYSRFSSVLVNLLVLALTLPCFLRREPSNLLIQSVKCATLAVPAMTGAAIGMMIELPGIPPAVSVFLPVAALILLSLVPWTFFKT